MRRAIRWAITLLFALGYVTLVGAWVRSYYHADSVRVLMRQWSTESQDALVFGHIDRGRIRVEYVTTGFDDEFARQRWRAFAYPRPISHTVIPAGSRVDLPPVRLSFAGFGIIAFHQESDSRKLPVFPISSYGIQLPFWFPTLVLLAICARKAWMLGRDLRRSRFNPTACKSCGYDLRAGHEKCPECGADSHVAATAGSVNATAS